MGTTRLAAERNKRRYHGSDDRYTPPWLLDRVTAFLGVGWFDPCPASFGRAPLVNGLAVPWSGRVYCNPPYSGLAPWVAKFTGDPFHDGLLLVPAYTDTRWFRPLYDFPILFTYGRIRFLSPDGQEMGQPPFGSALVYRGPHQEDFERAFDGVGRVTWPRPITPAATLWRTA